MIHYKTYTPDEKLPEGLILPDQVHGNTIVEIITGNEDLTGVDGVWTRCHPELDSGSHKLGVKTADCAPIVFWNSEMYGVVHSGWRGLVNGIVEEMLALCHSELDSESHPFQFYVGPLYPVFEIQKDECYEQLLNKFSDQYFNEHKDEEKVMFDFKSALQSLLPRAEFDPRSTFEEATLASWRRDQDQERNVTVVSTG